jgi:zinc/manganese transport system permease protein
VAGVLLVFSYLIAPALAGLAIGGSIATRLVVGWIFGAAVSLIGMLASATLDLPTGATVACVFGLALLAWSSIAHVHGVRRAATIAAPASVEPTVTGKGASP